jgi:integrase
MEAPIAFAMATGMRRGEVAALRGEHLDLDAGIVRVRESLASVGRKNVYVKTTKSGEPREIPLSPT